jgi:hypothetical protein
MPGWKNYLRETWKPPFSSLTHVYFQMIENPTNTKGEFSLYVTCLEDLDWFIKKGHYNNPVMWKSKGRGKTKGTHIEGSVYILGEWYSQRRWDLSVISDGDDGGEKPLANIAVTEFEVMVTLRNRTNGISQSY